MIHHYNYSTSLSHFLSYQQFDNDNLNNVDPEQTSHSITEDEGRCKSNSSATNKSFTIAAILGLQNVANATNPPHSVDNLSHHQTHHASLPTNQHHQQSSNNNNNNNTVVNLSIHNPATASALAANGCSNRLPPSVRQGAINNIALQQGVVGNPYGPPGNGGNVGNRNTVRGLKHLTHQVMASKKTCKSKRVRTIFTPEQLERLEAEFERQQYMVGPERLYLAHTLQLTEAQVKVWFQNRRIKWRKHHLEITHQRLAVLKQQQQMLIEESNLEAQDSNCSSVDT